MQPWKATVLRFWRPESTEVWQDGLLLKALGEALPAPAGSWWLQTVFGSLLHHFIYRYLSTSLVFAYVSQMVLVEGHWDWVVGSTWLIQSDQQEVLT